MHWLNDLIGSLLTVIGLDTSSKMGGSVQFFIDDVIKIAVLLCILIFGISYIQTLNEHYRKIAQKEDNRRKKEYFGFASQKYPSEVV